MNGARPYFLDALVKAIAMCDPVAYMYYLDSEREATRRTVLRPYPESDPTYIDQWAALSERLGLWQCNEDAGAGAAVTRATDQPRRATVMSWDGTRIDYEQRGSGPALVLVHGGLVDRCFWGPSLPLLAQHYTVYALDRRGHGNSDPYPADHAIEREYEDVAAMVAAVGEPVAVLGHSGGARVALHAARRTDQVRRLVLYEPPRFDSITPAALARLHASLEAEDFDDIVATLLVDVIAADMNPGLFPGARPQVLVGMRQSAIWAAVLRNVRSLPAEADSYATYHFEPTEFCNFITPTVLLLGSTSSPVMQGYVEDLYAALPVSRIMMLEGQGHGAMLEAPELFVRTVRAALDWASGV